MDENWSLTKVDQHDPNIDKLFDKYFSNRFSQSILHAYVI